jgi:DNA-directed RNA polymerase specialized sigma24 family protein
MLTEGSFNRLLEALDPDAERAGDRYEHLRRSLIKYFDWRGSFYSERDTDETIDRISRKLGEGQVFDDVFSYALGIARNVLLESLRSQEKEREASQNFVFINEDTEQEPDPRFTCFDFCLEQLPPSKRDLIIAYYEGDKRRKIANRKRLADESGMPINRLRIQVHRIREKLGECIENCLAKNGPAAVKR